MTSSYTTNKSIEKPANGDYVNTWSTPVNTDWDIIDKAFGGRTSLNAVGASGVVTLTATQYQAPIITITGALTANVNYQLPSGIGGFWYVYNNTSGAYTVTLSSAGGGSSLLLTQGYTTSAISDGTNVGRTDTAMALTTGSYADPSWISSLSASKLTGAVAVATGGTGGTTAAAARTNLGAAASGTNTDITTLNPTGGLQVGAPTGGAQGSGSINAAAIYVNGVSVGTSTGTVSSVAMTVPSFLSISGSPITSSGTLAVTLSGTALPVANGGTGATSAAAALTSLGAYAASNPSGYTSNTGTVTSVSGAGSPNGLTLTGTVTTSGSLTLGGDITSVNASATINGFTIGYRTIPRSTTTTTAVVGDVGKCIAVTAGITIPASTFAAGDAISIYNNSGSSITITQGSGLTMYLSGTATTGNRTLAQRGIATIWMNSATDCVISGGGLT